MTTIDEIVVIGAGVAGLTCAQALRDAGLPALVLEATPVIGGRVRSALTASGAVWELGAQVLHGTGNPALAVLGPDLADASFREHDFRVLVDRTAMPLAALARRGIAPWALAPALAAAPPGGGRGSVQTWLRSATRGGLDRAAGTAWLQAEWAAAPSALDSAELGRWVRDRGPASAETVVARGLSRLPEQLAQGLRIRIGTPARRVQLLPRGVAVRTDDAELVSPAAVITVPPWTVRAGELRIADMRDDRPRAVTTLHGGDAVVAVVETDVPAPGSLTVLDADTPTGFVRCVTGRPEVQLIAKGPGAQRLREVLAHRAALIDLLAAALPWTADAVLGGVLRADWGCEPFQRGAFSTPTAGSAAARRAWRTPIGRRVFFAGEATCEPGGLARIHGAMDSGRTAARDVWAALAGTADVA